MIIKREKRKIRQKRVRAKVIGVSQCPRLSVFRSNKHLFLQIIDDKKGKTIVSASDLELKIATNAKIKKIEIAYQTGQLIAKKVLDKNIKKIVFDRNGYKYHGRVKAVAEGAKTGGLKF
jgi:large subunit ribosomal protein L18